VRREYPDAPIVGVGAVVIEHSKVLLVRRGQAPLKGEWSLPGGALELGETLQQGVIREVFEETGLTVAPQGLIEVLDRIIPDRVSGKIHYHYVLVDFVCTVIGGVLSGGSDADEARWVEREHLRDYSLAPITLQVITKAFAAA
jgi:8-oxo-dGTP diphosphatase